MKLFRFARPAVVGLAGILVLSSCTAGQQAAPGAGGAAAGRQRPAVVISVATAKEGKIATVLTYSGTIQAHGQVNVVAKATSRVVKMPVDLGSSVKAGDVLVELEHDSLDAQVKQAEANVASAEARLATVIAGGRVEDVAASQAALVSAQAKYEQVRNGALPGDLQAAEGTVASAQAKLDQAKATLNRLKVPATQDEITQAKAAVDKATAAVKKAQSDYDAVSWRGDIAASSQATALAQATTDYQAAQAAFNIKLNPRQEDILAAEKGVASAEADLTTAKVKLDQLRGGPTDQDLTIAESTVQQATNQLALKKTPYTDSDVKSAQAAVAQARAALDVTRTARSDAMIIAPFDGYVSQRLLAPGALATTNIPILVLVSKDLEMMLNVEEARVAQFRPGQAVELSVPAYAGQTFMAKVAAVAPAADAKAHTFAVQVVPDVQGAQLKPGMFADVKITTVQKDTATLIPREALIQKSGKSLVYVPGNGQAKVREVTVGLSDESNVEIVAGLASGEQVITAGSTSVSDGDPVRIAGLQDQQGTPSKPGQPGQKSGQGGSAGKADAAPVAEQAKSQDSGASN